jgi:hypothetical protein
MEFGVILPGTTPEEEKQWLKRTCSGLPENGGNAADYGIGLGRYDV